MTEPKAAAYKCFNEVNEVLRGVRRIKTMPQPTDSQNRNAFLLDLAEAREEEHCKDSKEKRCF